MQHKVTNQFDTSELSFEDFKAIVIKDYKIAYESRQVSLQGRKEALTGKAKFGIFGDGKEIAQVAMSKAFKNGDWRSGYYRDQTVMFATGMATVKQFFAQLYAHPDLDHEPHSGGRQMNAHFASRSINPDGSWKDLTQMKNSASDVSSTATQMARLIGLAQASKLYRQNPELKEFSQFSINGNEVAFGTIGNASTSEGLFFEAINAAGVLQIPLAISIWDDGYGISVPNKYQTTKEDISEVLKGFQRTKDKPGIEIFKVKGWDYVALCETYETAIKMCREEHVPVLIHVTEMTQPQGHSTSGSHERYKSNERLEWEREYDCIAQMRKWMLESAIATEEEISELEDTIKNEVRTTIKQSWTKFLDSVKVEKAQTLNLLENLGNEVPQVKKIALIYRSEIDPLRKEMFGAIRKALRITRFHDSDAKSALKKWYEEQKEINKERYNSGLFS